MHCVAVYHDSVTVPVFHTLLLVQAVPGTVLSVCHGGDCLAE